jgi:uncharacterized membrane protein (DUF373 family)
MSKPEVNWDGVLREIIVDEAEEEIKFSAISILLVVMIAFVCISVAFLNRALLIQKLRPV